MCGSEGSFLVRVEILPDGLAERGFAHGREGRVQAVEDHVVVHVCDRGVQNPCVQGLDFLAEAFDQRVAEFLGRRGRREQDAAQSDDTEYERFSKSFGFAVHLPVSSARYSTNKGET